MERKNRRPVGAGLSLDKFASLGVSKFDKRKKLERIKKQKLIQHSKYSKLKKKLEAQGILAPTHVKDSVAELEALDGIGSGEGTEEPDHEDLETQSVRAASHAHAGPRVHAPQQQGPGKGHTNTGEHGPNHASAEATIGPRKAAGGRHQLPDMDGAAVGRQQQTHKKRRMPDNDTDAGPKRQNRAEQAKHAPEAHQGNREVRESPDMDADERAMRGGSGAAKRAAGRGADAGGGERRPKKLSQLQRLAQQVAEEKAEQQRAKEEAMKARQERQQRVAAVEKARKEEKHQHFKRNAKGQPLMRYRMEKLLAKIQTS